MAYCEGDRQAGLLQALVSLPQGLTFTIGSAKLFTDDATQDSLKRFLSFFHEGAKSIVDLSLIVAAAGRV